MATTSPANSHKHKHKPEGSQERAQNSSPAEKASKMPSSPNDKQYCAVLASPTSPQGAAATHHRNSTDSDDMGPAFWKTPVDIDDADLTFDGKPLNLLHEENQSRWMLEHRVSGEAEGARGRAREVDYSRRKGDSRASRASKT